ncbi:MAG: formate dehydrogenase [Pseudomonadota bacterium]
MTKENETKADRRSFLKLIGASAVGGGAVVAASGAAVAGVKDEPAPGGDYRDSEHVRRYYGLARDF